jgi:23S rRNA pseudouridine2605 synthase
VSHREPHPEGERLQKILARVGFGSRRVCEEIIAEGRVTVDGVVAELGKRVDVESQVVAVDGAPVGVRPDLVYYLLNKPAGVITTADDPQGRPTVVEVVPDELRVFPVGVEKEYLALVEGEPSRASLRTLRDGVDLEDGPTARARVTAVEPNLLRITIHEGRNRQVRRMCDAVGHPVVRLVRTRIGPITDPRLAPGEWRELTRDEVRSLEVASASEKPATGSEPPR